MRNKITALLTAVLILFTAFPGVGFAYDAVFSDVPADAWEAPYVYDLVGRGILSGYGDGTFGPRITVQRCEYAKMLVGITNTPLSTSVSTPYADVPAWEWYFPYVNSSLSYITGFTDNGVLTFQPEADATREDVTVALIKALGTDLSPYDDPTGFLSQRFSDVSSISVHNRVYIAAAVDKGYITGDENGTFRGQDSIIRAEIVAILCRAFPLVNDTNSDLVAVNDTLTAFFLDVGQGDCCYLELPGGKTMLIDAGTAAAEDTILHFLQARSCRRLDYVIATHPHADHIGSMTAVLKSVPVGTIYMPKVSTNTKTFEKLLETILAQNIPVITAKSGVTIDLSPSLSAVFLAPSAETDDLNNASAVLRLSYGENDFLFAGDAESASEALMLQTGLPLDAEVLKVGHHGSDTSSTGAFLAAVHPQFAVISCGAGNSYGHPKQVTQDALTQIGAAVYRTDLNGTITVSGNGADLQIHSER